MESWWWFSFKSFFRSSVCLVRPVRSFVRPWVGLAFIQICRLETEKVKWEKMRKLSRLGDDGKKWKNFRILTYRLFPSSVQERRIEWQFDRQCWLVGGWKMVWQLQKKTKIDYQITEIYLNFHAKKSQKMSTFTCRKFQTF